MIDQNVQEVYARSGWGGRLRWGRRPAVVVVDLINAFTDADYALGSDLTAEVDSTARLLDTARAHGAPVILTTIAFAADLSDAGVWAQKCAGLSELVRGSAAVEIDERLAPTAGEIVIEKHGASAFFGTILATHLAARQIDSIILCGASTSGCIRATAVDAMQHGYPCVIPDACVGDRSPGPHEANLFDINEKYADVAPLDQVLRYLSRTGRGGESAG